MLFLTLIFKLCHVLVLVLQEKSKDLPFAYPLIANCKSLTFFDEQIQLHDKG